MVNMESCLTYCMNALPLLFGIFSRPNMLHELSVTSVCVFFCFFPCVAGSVGKFRGHGSDGNSVLPAGWSAPDYSQQHRPSARLRKTPLQFQQVSSYRSKSCSSLGDGAIEFKNRSIARDPILVPPFKSSKNKSTQNASR